MTSPTGRSRSSARKALGQIEGRAGADLAAAVARLVGSKKPAGGVEALLNYLPYADDAAVLDSVGTALAQLAYLGGQAHPALLSAVESDLAVQRATAVEALTRTDHPETRPAIAKRLSDPARAVRQRAALALARVEDVSAIPVLVDLMGDLNKVERMPVDEMLRSLAGETAPKNHAAGGRREGPQGPAQTPGPPGGERSMGRPWWMSSGPARWIRRKRPRWSS